ncbi:MAG: hypothetical protein HOF99_13235 [Rhodospirillaceae bacterium]|nr:hypothetical protein [Rhodospirillaceae bacterium]
MSQTAPARSPETRRRLARPLFIGNEIYRRSNFGQKHPLSVPRVPATIDLCRAMGWLPDNAYIESAAASPAEIVRFHAPEYLQALRRGERSNELTAEERERYNLGRLENPIHILSSHGCSAIPREDHSRGSAWHLDSTAIVQANDRQLALHVSEKRGRRRIRIARVAPRVLKAHTRGLQSDVLPSSHASLR